MLEKDVETKLKNFLKNEKMFYVKTHGSQYQSSGLPDLLIGYKNYFFFVEIKLSKNKLTLLQYAVFEKIKEALNEFYFIITEKNVNEFLCALKKFKENNSIEELIRISKDSFEKYKPTW